MKKLLVLSLLLGTLIIIGCSSQNPGETASLQLTEQERQALGMTIHMCMMGGGENCDEYLDPINRDLYGELMQEQCDLMPGMEACDVYFE